MTCPTQARIMQQQPVQPKAVLGQKSECFICDSRPSKNDDNDEHDKCVKMKFSAMKMKRIDGRFSGMERNFDERFSEMERNFGEINQKLDKIINEINEKENVCLLC